MIEHEGDGPDGGDRVGDAFAGDVGRGAMDWLEHAGVAASGSMLALAAMPMLPARALPRSERMSPKRLLADDDIERLGPKHESRGHGVDQPCSVSTVGIFGGDPGEDSSQSVMPYCWALLLVTLVTFLRRVAPARMRNG